MNASHQASCHTDHGDHCHHHGEKTDYLFLGGLLLTVLGYGLHLLLAFFKLEVPYLSMYSHTVFEMFNRMWWGLLLGIMFVGMLSKVPKAFVLAIIGAAGTKQGILRATLAGILLDLCSHGILLVGMKLYERGAGLGQVVAFLVASPWNSFSLTLILISLIGWQWTGFFIVASAVIAIVSGMLFDLCVRKGILPQNPNAVHDDIDFHFLSEMKKGLARTQFNTKLFSDMARSGIAESRMILKWIFLGVIIAGLMRTFTDPSQFQSLFGPTLAGLGLTLVAATIIEVCSEGAVPIAADILTRAHAPGNAFAFLMAGVATDYTEIMGLKERTKSWKIALFLPLISLPQVILVSWLINVYN